MTAGYLAMSVTVASDRVFRSFLGDDLGERTLYHGHSYGGNALAAAVALRHLELFDAWNVLANVRERSDELRNLLHDRVASKPAVREVRFEGLMGGVELAPPTEGLRWGRRVSAAAVERGVLLRPIGDTVVLMPPLTITSPEIHQIVNALSDSIDERAGTRATCRMPPMTWDAWATSEARSIRAAGRWRAPRDLDAVRHRRHPRRDAEGRRVVSFASNDYLGLTSHPTVIAAAHAALDRWGTGSGSARLIVGSRPIHSELERELAAWKETERTVLFPTGFAANLGVLSTFGDRGVIVCSDELNHASIIDGCRLARADVDRLPPRRPRPSPHAPARSRWPARAGRERHRVLDGRRRCRCRRADRAVRARNTRSSCSTKPTRCSARTCTSSPMPTCCASAPAPRPSPRSAGSSPARPRYVELIENSARPYIFTTAPTPADTAAALAALRIVRSDEGDLLRARLRANVDRLRPGHPSPILPVPVRRGTDRASTPPRPSSSTDSSCPRSGRRPSRPARRACGSR